MRHLRLRVKLDIVADAPTRWIFDVNYPSLDRIDLFQLADGEVTHTFRLGDSLLIGERPLRGRSHAVELVFEPGKGHELLMRVQTTSSMILPLSLSLPAQFQARESAVEASQGLFAGIGICLLIYSLVNWIALRDHVFGYYATSIAGITLFFLVYNGLAPEYLWPDSLWLTKNAAPLSIMVGLWGGFLFLERTLRVSDLNRALSMLMIALGWLAFAIGISLPLGLIDYRTVHLFGTLLGPLPMLLSLPIAYVRMREGDRVMVYLFVGWGLYAIGVVVMAALLRGLVPSNSVTQHAFQIGSMLEMMFWLVLLGQRVEQIRRTGERDRREHAALRSLALTDSLTGLTNRRGLGQVLAGAVNRSGSERLTAVFMLDLDGFKPVNDRYGHDAGDLLLITVANRLRERVRDADLVSRLGGDEFVIVAEGLRTAEAAQLYGQNLMDAFKVPFELPGGRSCHVGATIGYALAPPDGRDPSGLLKRADTAMYEGKQNGKRCLRRSVSKLRLAAA
jgi:diguanylate cyclase